MRRLFLVALALTILLPLLAVMLVFLAAAGESAAQCGIPLGAAGPVGGVPAADVPIFEGAAARFALGARGPSILAAINYVESTFGQSNDAGVHSGANYAGAMGPMQFLQGTWDQYKVQAPGGAMPPNVYDEADAVYSAANYLKASGAPGDWPGAIFAYNHSSAYVQQVLSQAQSYYTQGLTAQGSATSTTTSGASSGSAIADSPFSVPAASGDPAGPITLAPGQPTIVAATYFTDQTGAWGDNLLINHDSYAELSPGIPASQVTRQNATMLGGLPYMTPLRVTNPQNGRSVILYKRDIGAGQPLSSTLDGYHYRIDLTAWADQQLGLPGSGIVQVTRLTGPVSTPGGGQACSASSGFAPAGSGIDPIPGFTIGRDDMGVDASAPVGTRIYAPLDSQLVEVVPQLVLRAAAAAVQIPAAAGRSPDGLLVRGRADHPGQQHGRNDLPRPPGRRPLRPKRHLDRDRLGITNLQRPHPRPADGRQRRRKPAGRSDHALGGELQTLLRHPLTQETRPVTLRADPSMRRRTETQARRCLRHAPVGAARCAATGMAPTRSAGGPPRGCGQAASGSSVASLRRARRSASAIALRVDPCSAASCWWDLPLSTPVSAARSLAVSAGSAASTRSSSSRASSIATG